MRRIAIYTLMLISILTSCTRRPLTTADFSVIVNIEIEKDIINYEVKKDPSLMRCIFYDHETGAFVTQAFLPAKGGNVSLTPDRTYDILVYNFDTESTWIEQENWFHSIYASTSLIPDSFKTKLKTRGSKDGEEDIVYDPDHLFVGRMENVYIPSRSVEAPAYVIDIKAETVVQTWIVEVRNVTGKENIGTIASVVTALAEYNKIAYNQRSMEYVSVYFDNHQIDNNGLLTAKFNTFGANPDNGQKQILSLVFTDLAGKGYVFDFDVTDQIRNNKDQIIRITAEIDIPKPITSGDGGFAPVVDDWDDINTDILI